VGTKGIGCADRIQANGADRGECELPGGIDNCVLNEILGLIRPPRWSDNRRIN